MRNELLLIATLLIEYTAVVLAHRFYGKIGLYSWIAIATVLANIEVLILVEAFGIEMTLGNVLFASTFLATDCLSVFYGKDEAKTGVTIGIVAAVAFAVISISWIAYIPTENSIAADAIHQLFAFTPRVVAASIIVYAIVQRLDVALYHRIWQLTANDRNPQRMLWLRNNGATIISQVINAILYNVLAFWGIYGASTLIAITVSNIVIYLVTSLADTPFIYLARKLDKNKEN